MRMLIAWFTRNPVAANLLMFSILVGGLLTGSTIRQEVIPTIPLDMAQVMMAYPGAAPAEVEVALCAPIEEAVRGLAGVDSVSSVAYENLGAITIKFLDGVNAGKLLDDIKNAVDRISSFPKETETPRVVLLEGNPKVMDVVVSGQASPTTLRRAAGQVREALLAHPSISLVEFLNAPAWEISIEVSQAKLREYDLSLEEVSAAVRMATANIPGGLIRSEGGEVLLRGSGRAKTGPEFSVLPLRSLPDGRQLRLEDVATIRDGFAETDQATTFNGRPAVSMALFRLGTQHAPVIAQAARKIVGQQQELLPTSLAVAVANDDTVLLRDRLGLMLRNARAGLVLVLISLALFLRLRLALWVTVGIPIAFLGALWLLPSLNTSINLISLFAFILVLGIVVDDAIVVAENIHQKRKSGLSGEEAAIEGTNEVAIPVLFAILTTIAAFWPLTDLPGQMGAFAHVLPMVVIGALAFSLVEALLVLPTHLRNLPVRQPGEKRGRWGRLQDRLNAGMETVRDRFFVPLMRKSLQRPWLTLAIGAAGSILTLTLVISGTIRFNFFPDVEADNIAVQLTMPLGTPAEETRRVLTSFEDAALALSLETEEEFGRPIVRSVQAAVGSQPYRQKQAQWAGDLGASFSGAHLGEVNLELHPSDERRVGAQMLLDRWRELSGSAPGAEELIWMADMLGGDGDADLQLSGPDSETLKSAADSIAGSAKVMAGVLEVHDTHRPGKREIRLTPTPLGESMGIGLGNLAMQVRRAFHGEKIGTVQRGNEQVEIHVRLQREERNSLAGLENMRVRDPQGADIPLSLVAKIEETTGSPAIHRSERRRTLDVFFEIDKNQVSVDSIVSRIEEEVLPALTKQHPDLRWKWEGRQKEERDFMLASANKLILALVMIFVLLAIPLRSYLAPFAILAAVPFGLVGAIWGHVLVGFQLSVFSMIGGIALTGVVVNDSLILIDLFRRIREEKGGDPAAAMLEAGKRRFRPIMLTTLTTFLGLSPILLETSLQARFIQPMAVSLGCGVLFATMVTLIVVPASWMAIEDLRLLAVRATRSFRKTS